MKRSHPRFRGFAMGAAVEAVVDKVAGAFKAMTRERNGRAVKEKEALLLLG